MGPPMEGVDDEVHASLLNPGTEERAVADGDFKRAGDVECQQHIWPEDFKYKCGDGKRVLSSRKRLVS